VAALSDKAQTETHSLVRLVFLKLSACVNALQKHEKQWKYFELNYLRFF